MLAIASLLVTVVICIFIYQQYCYSEWQKAYRDVELGLKFTNCYEAYSTIALISEAVTEAKLAVPSCLQSTEQWEHEDTLDYADVYFLYLINCLDGRQSIGKWDVSSAFEGIESSRRQVTTAIRALVKWSFVTASACVVCVTTLQAVSHVF